MAARNREQNGRRFRREPRVKLSRRATVAVRVALFFVVPVLALILFPLSTEPLIEIPVEGEISRREIIAPIDFPVKKDADALAAEREAAALAEPPVLDIDPTVTETLTSRLDRIERELMRPPADRLPTAEFRVSVARQLGIELSAESVELLRGETGAALIESARRFVTTVMSDAVVPAEVMAALAGKEVVDLRRGASNVYKALTAVRTVEQVEEAVVAEAARLYADDPIAGQAFIELARPLMTPNAVYALEETNRRVAAAGKAVPTITHVVNSGIRIIDSHQRVTAEHVRVIRSLREYQQEHLLTGPVGGSLVRNTGRFGALCLLLLAFLLYLRVQQPQIYGNTRLLALVTTLGSLAVIMAYAVVIHLELSALLVPVAILPLLATLLLQRGVALFIALMTPFLFMILLIPHGLELSPDTLIFIIGSSVGGVTAVLAVENIQKRHELYWPVVLVGCAYGLVAVVLGMALRLPITSVAARSLEGALSAFLAGALTMVLLPVYERAFRITTNFTLLELLDRNHPLLARMSMEAPGTFHHSMLVSELAREAVTVVGGNPLLAQVGAYYHDIGKMMKPQYFYENQTGRNAHDKLTPTMSCLVLGSHVREGVLMAREAKLPSEVIDFITEHHGTALMSFFYHKAKEADENIDPTDFRYPGPRPHSKETAIVMLADSVEATARSLDDPTDGSLRAVVKRLIDARLHDGQFDSSPLTLADLARVREAFVLVLRRFFHHRIQYPGQPAEPSRRGDNGRRTTTEVLVAPQGEALPKRRRESAAAAADATMAPDGSEMINPPPSAKPADGPAASASTGEEASDADPAGGPSAAS